MWLGMQLSYSGGFIEAVDELRDLERAGLGIVFVLTRRYGYEAEAERIQDLYLNGKKDEAAVAVPDDLARAVSLIGPAGYVKERISAFAEAGVTTLSVSPVGTNHADRAGRIRLIEQLVELLP